MQLGLGLGLTHVQQAGGGGEETPAWLEDFRAPSGDLPTAALSFADGNYFDGAEVGAVDVVAEDMTDWQEPFSLSDIVADVGLRATGPEQSLGPVLIGAAAAAACSGSGTTIVVDLTITGSVQNGVAVRLSIFDAPDFTDEKRVMIAATDDGTGDSRIFDVDGFVNLGPTASGEHKFAWSIASGKNTVSVDGAAIVNRSPTPGAAPNRVGIRMETAADQNGPVIIRSIAIYPLQADADLPVLSALS